MTEFTLPEDEDFTVTIDDVRRLFCGRGARRWFEGGNAGGVHFDFRDFIKNGRSARELLATGDGLAVKVVKAAYEARRSDG